MNIKTPVCRPVGFEGIHAKPPTKSWQRALAYTAVAAVSGGSVLSVMEPPQGHAPARFNRQLSSFEPLKQGFSAEDLAKRLQFLVFEADEKTLCTQKLPIWDARPARPRLTKKLAQEIHKQLRNRPHLANLLLNLHGENPSYDGPLEIYLFNRRSASCRVVGQSFPAPHNVISIDSEYFDVLEKESPCRNVVHHEVSHQLDRADGKVDGGLPGMQPRQLKMIISEFTRGLRHYWRKLAGNPSAMDSLPGIRDYPFEGSVFFPHSEFTSVITESFQACPGDLMQGSPKSYQILSEYYGLDPLAEKNLNPAPNKVELGTVPAKKQLKQ
jgi:hypothetical protein